MRWQGKFAQCADPGALTTIMPLALLMRQNPFPGLAVTWMAHEHLPEVIYRTGLSSLMMFCAILW